MDAKELRTILEEGENETVEFTMRVPPSGSVVSAFANTRGGRIFFPVSDSGKAEGVSKLRLELVKAVVTRFIEKSISPPLDTTIEEVNLDEKTAVFIINIPEGKNKPYGFRGGYFTRTGTATIEISREKLITFFRSDKRLDEEYIAEIYKKVTAIEKVIDYTLKRKKGTNIFISHGGHPEVLQLVEEFLQSLDLNPIVVKEEASEGLSIDDKVEKYIKASECAVILFTPDDEMTNGEFFPRQNVIHEVGLIQQIKPDKIIYLKDEKATVPSNITPKVYTTFSNTDLSRAFIQMITELKVMELI